MASNPYITGLCQKPGYVLFIVLVIVSPLLLADPGQYIADQDEPHAMIISNLKQSGKLIYPVQIYSINGERITFRRQGLLLKPGQYRLGANRAAVPRDEIPGLSRDVTRPSQQALDIDVEAGKAYYIGLKADSSRSEDWQLVVWKVEPGGRALASKAD